MQDDNGHLHSLAEAVRNEINSMPHVKTALGDGVINYSALSRKLMPSLSKKLNRKLNEESVIVAIKRYADELGETEVGSTYLDMVASAELLMQDNMAYTQFRKSEKVISKLERLFTESEWKPGEMRIFIQGAEEVIVIVKNKRLEQILGELQNEAISSISDRALISFAMPVKSGSIYGIIAELTRVLAQKGISIELVSSPTDLHFLVKEKDAEKAYATLKDLISVAKKMTEGKSE